MENNSMTARVSAFSRAYHSTHSIVPIFNDPLARTLLGETEYHAVAQSMTGGISYFCPGWSGTDEQALRWIVDHCLSATPLARAAFAEDSLQQAAARGARQYLIFGAGLDSFAYRQPAWASCMTLFEIDLPSQTADKQARVQTAGLSVPDNLCWISADLSDTGWTDSLTGCTRFDDTRISFCSLLGLLYYLSEADTERLLCSLGALLPSGSTLVFDYPDAGYAAQQRTHTELAAASDEAMHTGSSPEEMDSLLARCGFRIAEDWNADTITERYFAAHNQADPMHPMAAQGNVRFCLAVKQ